MYALAGQDATMTEYPPAEMTLAFHQKHAPAELTWAPSYARLGPGSLRVETIGVRPGDVPPTPAIAYLKFAHVLGNELPDRLACDMRHGVVLLHQLSQPDEPVRVIGRVPFPAHIEVADLDGDGRLDVVAVLWQQFETVLAYLQCDDWDFEPRILFAAPHPDWGSVGIEVVDLDGDIDLVTGNFAVSPEKLGTIDHWLTVFENQRS